MKKARVFVDEIPAGEIQEWLIAQMSTYYCVNYKVAV